MNEFLQMDKVSLQKVIITTTKRRGDGKSNDNPVRVITEVFTKDGRKIAEYDPHTQSTCE